MDSNQTSGIAGEIELAKLTVPIGKLLLHRTVAFTSQSLLESHDNVGATLDAAGRVTTNRPVTVSLLRWFRFSFDVHPAMTTDSSAAG